MKQTAIALASSTVADQAFTDTLIAGVMRRNTELAYLTMDKTHRDTWADSDFIAATDSPADLAKVYFLVVRQFVKGMVGGDEHSEYASDLSENTLASLYKAMGDSFAQESVRVKKVTNGYSIYMPCSGKIEDSLSSIYGSSYYRANWETIKNSIEHALPGFFDLTRPLDVHLGRDAIENTLLEIPELEIDAEQAEICKRAIRGLRAVASPSRNRFEKQVANQQRIADWDEGDFQGDQYSATLALNAAWTTRNLQFFVEFFIPNEAAEYLTQEQGDSIRMSALAEYFANTQHLLFGGSIQLAPHVVSMKRIAADNAKSNIELVPRVDHLGVSVSQKGELYWIPNVTDPAFAEDSVEAGGAMPNGEWTMRDVVDPEANEYVQETTATGHVVRKRRPRGRNLLVYTDWHNSKLAYTQDDSRLKIWDISMFRPARPQNYTRVLSVDLESDSDLALEVLNSLHFVIQCAVKHGIQLPAGEEYNDPWFEAADLEILRRGFLEGQVPLLDILRVMRQVVSQGTRRHDGAELTPEQFRLAEAYTTKHKYPSLDMLSADSPVGIVRAIFAFFTEAARKFEENPDLAFGEFSVINTLGMLAYLRIVISLGGQYEQVRALDMEDRKLYLSPPLAAPDQIRVDGIPWVSGSVELMPHQVKVWNYMQHFPKNLILNVAAGGGKTLLALLYLAYGLGQGKWKKPLIACPGNLIKNYIIDASWLFKGAMNIVVINNTTVNSPEWGEDKLVQLIEHSPLNTIFITDYDFIVPKANSTRVVDYVYGNQKTQISLNCEMLKRAAWDALVADESHYLKEESSSRNREMNRLLSNIPYKVQMSGTYIADNLTDVVGEFGLMEPQVFGDKATFVEEFYPDGIRYAPVMGAQKMIRERMAENAMYVQIDRKEWAALLPRRYDAFYPVEMTPKQTLVYHKLMQLAEAEFTRLLNEREDLKEALEGETNEQDEDLDSLAESGQLGFYFQKLEQFASHPQNFPAIIEEDPRFRLSGADLISPKVHKVVELLRHHEQQGMPGKVLVWTQYVESAKHLYDNMPPDLKEASVYYTAATQDMAFAEFEKNPKKRYMFGCEKSMNTGHNLQYCDQIIRTENVWNWGTLEQGEARINRPRSSDPRKEENGGHGIHYSWLFVNKSIDVTKSSRMISKLISTIKFYNSDNHAYMQMDEPPPIKLSRANIFKVNDWQAGAGEDDEEAAKAGKLGCARYFAAYEKYMQLEEAEFRKFRENPDNHIEPYTLEQGHVPPGSGLLKSIPYVPGMKLYGQEKLGLVPYMEWVASTYAKGSIESNWDNPDFSPAGMKVHCEYGDCIAVDYNRARKNSNIKPKTMRVRTPNDKTASVPLAALWVITKAITSGREVREALAMQAGADTQAVVPHAEVPAPMPAPAVPEGEHNLKESKKLKGRLPEADPDGKLPGFEIFVEVYDNLLAIVCDPGNPHVEENEKELKHMGFFQAPAFDYAYVTRPDAIEKWIASCDKAGLKIDPAYRRQLEADAALMKQHRDLTKFVNGLAAAKRPNFFRAQMKPAPKGTIKPYLFVVTYPPKEGGTVQRAILCMNHRGNAASLSSVRKIRTPGVAAWKGPRGGELMAMVNNKNEAQTLLRKLGAQFDILNMQGAISELNRVKFIPAKNPPAA